MIDNSDLNELLLKATKTVKAQTTAYRSIDIFYSEEIGLGKARLYTDAFLAQVAKGTRNHIAAMIWDKVTQQSHDLFIYLVGAWTPVSADVSLTETIDLDTLSAFERLSWAIVNRLTKEELEQPFAGATLVYRTLPESEGHFKSAEVC